MLLSLPKGNGFLHAINERMIFMKKIKELLSHIFIDGLSGMALGLFATLIIGTIVQQVGVLVPGKIGEIIVAFASVAKGLTGAGIGVGVAYKYKEAPLVTLSAASAGMIGAFASTILSGNLVQDGALVLSGPGEPLGAFLAAFAGITIGHFISGRTKLDIILTPLISISSGGLVGILVGPSISKLMYQLGELINRGTQQQPLLMGVIVSVLMGMILTLPISSAALGIILNLSGLPAGAAAVGCSAQMVGFAVASFEDNKIGGLLAQGIGTSMLQVPNIMRKPIIWIPPILTSAILGPVSTVVLKMTNNATGSGMGTAGLVGQIMGYQTMVAEGKQPVIVLIEIVVMHFIAPAILTYLFTLIMKKMRLIKPGDMKLNVE